MHTIFFHSLVHSKNSLLKNVLCYFVKAEMVHIMILNLLKVIYSFKIISMLYFYINNQYNQ